MTYELISVVHISSAVLAIVCGSTVILLRKGTRKHKRLGYVYVTSMVLLNISALLIFRLTGFFGPFHYMALISLITVFVGFVPALFRQPKLGWIYFHYYCMAWSYVGLLAAAAAEAAVRMPSAPFWPAVIVSSILIIGVGGFQINKRQKHIFLTIGAQQAAPADSPQSGSLH